MKIVTYTNKEGANLGLLLNDKIYSLKSIANTMNAFLQMGDTAMENAKSIESPNAIIIKTAIGKYSK